VLIETIFLSSKELIYLIIIFLFVLFLNLRNQLFLGDNGSYSLGFFLGFILIKIYNLNDNLSPYFIILLLWYPCFEKFILNY
jgi:UDP-N-acetylmuramyl pentapeptide phosphotransferase/UDP-N-acetylglucosamine-1-phosphate transferase